METLIQLAELVAGCLDRDGPSDIAKMLRDKARVPPSAAEYGAALTWIVEIGGAPRGLEDIYISGLSQDEWYLNIANLRDEAARLRHHKMEINVSDESKTATKTALEMVRARSIQFPQDEAIKIALEQVTYLNDCCVCGCGDRLRVSRIDVGLYAVRELEFSDPDLASALKQVQYIAYNIGAGLKV